MGGLNITDLLLAGLRGRRTARDATHPENPLFDRAFYAGKNPHVVEGGVDLYEHYSYFGCRNGYDPNPYFDSAWYIARNHDVAATGANPLDHYLERGAIEGRDPSPAFSTWLYLILHPDVRATGINPLLHFLLYGKAEGRSAPPVCLLPSIAAMREGVAEADSPRIADAEPTIHLLRAWTEKLLDAGRR